MYMSYWSSNDISGVYVCICAVPPSALKLASPQQLSVMPHTAGISIVHEPFQAALDRY